jgi:hypothetical protein
MRCAPSWPHFIGSLMRCWTYQSLAARAVTTWSRT